MSLREVSLPASILEQEFKAQDSEHKAKIIFT